MSISRRGRVAAAGAATIPRRIRAAAMAAVSRRMLAATGAAAAVAGLTACDSEQVGTAATAGGDRLTVSELQDQVTETVKLRNAAIEEHDLGVQSLDLAGDVSQVQQSELQRWLTVRLYDEVAEDLEIEVSESEVDDFLDQLATQYPEEDLAPLLAEQNLTEETVRSVARVQLINEQLVQVAGDQAAAQEAITAAMERLEIEVNPRYGTWTETGLQPGGGSVSVSADEAAASS